MLCSKISYYLSSYYIIQFDSNQFSIILMVIELLFDTNYYNLILICYLNVVFIGIWLTAIVIVILLLWYNFVNNTNCCLQILNFRMMSPYNFSNRYHVEQGLGLLRPCLIRDPWSMNVQLKTPFLLKSKNLIPKTRFNNTNFRTWIMAYGTPWMIRNKSLTFATSLFSKKLNHSILVLNFFKKRKRASQNLAIKNQ